MITGKACLPALHFLDPAAISAIIEKAFGLLVKPGIRINHCQTLDMLHQNGARVDMEHNMAHISPDLVEHALQTVPPAIALYNQSGCETARLDHNCLSFVAGSSAPFILDADTHQPRAVQTDDLIRFLRLSDRLTNLQHANPALIPSDVPEKVSDVFRCFLALKYASKPLAVGMTRLGSFGVLKEMLAACAGSEKEMQIKPRLTFACTTRSPLTWDESAAENLIDCATSGIPVRIIPAPISGATAPATLMGTVVQHTAENLSGIVIHQLANGGAPIICGSAATVMDMKSGASLFGSIESKMINVANCQVAGHLKVPSYALLSFSDAKRVDAQAGLESISGVLLGVLAGVRMIGGAGMMESGLCQSFEKLVIDNDICGMCQRLAAGMACSEDAFANDLIEEIGPKGNFLTTRHTLSWARSEQYYPSNIIHRSSKEDFTRSGSKDVYKTAQEIIHHVLADDESAACPEDEKSDLVKIMSAYAKHCGVAYLPHQEKMKPIN